MKSRDDIIHKNVFRWRDWLKRVQSGLLLMTCFYILVKIGPIGLFFLTIIVQVDSRLLYFCFYI